jgi:hypothetical protein
VVFAFFLSIAMLFLGGLGSSGDKIKTDWGVYTEDGGDVIDRSRRNADAIIENRSVINARLLPFDRIPITAI